MPEQAVRTGPIHLDFKSVQQVVVHPEDQDRFTMTAREAAQACQRAQNDKDFEEEFKRMLVRVREWAQAHEDAVVAAYVYTGDGQLNVLMATQGPGFRSDLSDDLTELDLSLVDEFPWLVAEVMQRPADAVAARGPLENAIQVYGDGSRA
jgi:hypothetical protein